ncbi:DedA family protein [Rossellomorea aquimaris]|uniref:DedA family protein n=1 Tax=Rossellomorea aquimaris TaxID=189382 RepID=UPI0007D0A954|nr:VTT domain-containing protein [Rossellomorea aquimaris]
MFEVVIKLIKELGMWGLFAGNAIEASSLPFPGALVTLTYGYLLDPSWSKLIILAVSSSLIYTVFSYIPYGIGYKLKDKLKEKTSSKKIAKGQKWFRKCGLWSIAITRPLGIGNYVSYVAGISKVNMWKFGALTFIGIFPVTFAMLVVGKNGNLKSVQSLMSNIQTYLIVGLGVILVGYLVYKYVYKKKEEDVENDGKNSCLKDAGSLVKQTK